METKNENLNPQQSLEIISSMISQVKGNIRSSSFYFLLWGWVITFCNVGMYYFFKFTTYQKYAPIVWTLCIPAWIITMIYASRQEKKAGVVTHLDRISMWLWIGMAITILPAWIFGAQTNWMVNAIILMPVGMATFLSGIIIRFRPLILGGITFWIAGTLSLHRWPDRTISGRRCCHGVWLPGSGIFVKEIKSVTDARGT